MNNLLKDMKLLNEDHTPEGFPAVRMSEINGLVGIIEKQAMQLAKANESALFYKEQYEKTDRECTKLAMREAKANEREKRLEKILQRYESEQLQPLKLRVKELESAILDSCSTYHFEPDLSQPVSSLNELLIINSKWTLDPEISSDAARFAIENQVKGLKDYQYLCGYSDSRKSIDARIAQLEEQLRKEQDNV